MIHTWANIALIFLIILSVIAWAIPLALLALSVKGMRSAHQQLAALLPKAQAGAQRATLAVEHGSEQVARPIIRAYGRWAYLRGVGCALREQARELRNALHIHRRGETNR